MLVAAASIAHASPADGLPTEFRPSFPLFGGGPVVNFLGGDNQAITNASAHVAWSVAIPLIAERLWGRKGMWIAGLSWIGFTLVQESLFHAPPNAGPAYAAEFRSDLITRIVPCGTILLYDYFKHRGMERIEEPFVPIASVVEAGLAGSIAEAASTLAPGDPVAALDEHTGASASEGSTASEASSEIRPVVADGPRQ